MLNIFSILTTCILLFAACCFCVHNEVLVLQLFYLQSCLICRKENLDKLLLSNQSLDPRELFAQKCSFNLSDGNLQLISVINLFRLLLLLNLSSLACSLQFFQFTYHNVASDKFPFDGLSAIRHCQITSSTVVHMLGRHFLVCQKINQRSRKFVSCGILEFSRTCVATFVYIFGHNQFVPAELCL